MSGRNLFAEKRFSPYPFSKSFGIEIRMCCKCLLSLLYYPTILLKSLLDAASSRTIGSPTTTGVSMVSTKKCLSSTACHGCCACGRLGVGGRGSGIRTVIVRMFGGRYSKCGRVLLSYLFLLSLHFVRLPQIQKAFRKTIFLIRLHFIPNHCTT